MSQRFRLRASGEQGMLPGDRPGPLRMRLADARGHAVRGSQPGGTVANGEGTRAAPAADGRKAATQARIVRAAMSLFAERGYERTTIAAVAAEAGVSRAAIFWHFGDKSGLFQQTFRELLVPFFREMERSTELQGPRDQLMALFSIYEEFVEKNRETIQNFVRWVMESPTMRESLQAQLFVLHENFARDVRASLEEAIGDRAGAPELASALVSLLDGNLLLSFLDPDPETRRLRREGLRAMAELVLGDAAAR